MSHFVDIHVGQMIRQRRWAVGMTQQELGTAVGIKFQQVQKYEGGVNRVSASRLYDIAQTLGVSPGYFFETIPEDGQVAPAPSPHAKGRQAAGQLIEKEALDFLRNYYRLDSVPREKLLALTQSLTKNG